MEKTFPSVEWQPSSSFLAHLRAGINSPPVQPLELLNHSQENTRKSKFSYCYNTSNPCSALKGICNTIFRGPEAGNGSNTLVVPLLSVAKPEKRVINWNKLCTLEWPLSLQWYNDSFIPPKRPLLLHLLAVNLHIKQPTAEPVEWLAFYCWEHNPFSPALYPEKAGHDRCHSVKENIQWLKISNPVWIHEQLTSNKPLSGCSNITFQYTFLNSGIY